LLPGMPNFNFVKGEGGQREEGRGEAFESYPGRLLERKKKKREKKEKRGTA